MVDIRQPQAKLRTGLVVVIAALFLANGVALTVIDQGGGRASAQDGGGTTPADAGSPTTTLPSMAAEGAVGSASTTTTVKAKGKGQPTTTTTTEPDSPYFSTGEYTYEVTLTPMCVRVGAQLTLTMHLKVGSGGAMQVVYSDGSHDTQNAGLADSEGNLTFRWIASPSPGPASVGTVASDPETNKGGTTAVDFRVVGPNESC